MTHFILSVHLLPIRSSMLLYFDPNNLLPVIILYYRSTLYQFILQPFSFIQTMKEVYISFVYSICIPGLVRFFDFDSHFPSQSLPGCLRYPSFRSSVPEQQLKGSKKGNVGEAECREEGMLNEDSRLKRELADSVGKGGRGRAGCREVRQGKTSQPREGRSKGLECRLVSWANRVPNRYTRSKPLLHPLSRDL